MDFQIKRKAKPFLCPRDVSRFIHPYKGKGKREKLDVPRPGLPGNYCCYPP